MGRDRETPRTLQNLEQLIAGHSLGCSAHDLLLAHHAHRLLQFLEYLREWRPGRWRPEIRVLGGEHLDPAGRDGRGVLLWAAPFVSSNLVIKKAFYGLGLALVHLGDAFHGPTWSEFGRAFVNPVEVAAERRYLERRIEFWPDRRPTAVWETGKALEAGQIVSIGMGASAGQLLRLPLLNGHVLLPTGPATLSITTGAELLLVFTRRASDGTFVVEIREPTGAGESPPADRRKAAEDLLRRCHAALVQEILREPLAYRDWLDAASMMNG
jgi:lauroyl/myristoyl acyltransferase